jgi:hypothetical protein
MSRSEEHKWCERVEPWTEEQLADYYRLHGFVVQRSDVVDGGIPTRGQLDAMRAMPGETDSTKALDLRTIQGARHARRG